MINSSSRKSADHNNTPKQEDKTTTTDDHQAAVTKTSKASASSSSTTSWSRLKDPRIVRVSRAFGGKDRHSKVCTVRGLRDRRVRLSVPTAIQLYDLQDRLGLNQPSKVIDWLLNVAKHEIDELPPLQMPLGELSRFHLPLSATNNFHLLIGSTSHHDDSHQSAEKPERQANVTTYNDPLELATSSYWSTNLDMKSKEIVDEEREGNDTENWTKRKEGDRDRDHQQGHHHHHAYDHHVSSNNFVARPNQYSSNSLTGLLNNLMPSSSFIRWDPAASNLSLSHSEEDHPNQSFNFVPILPSTSLSMPSGSSHHHQFVVYPPVAAEFDPKQMINFEMLSSAATASQNSPLSNSSNFTTPPLYSIAQAMRPFNLSMNPYEDTAPTKEDD